MSFQLPVATFSTTLKTNNLVESTEAGLKMTIEYLDLRINGMSKHEARIALEPNSNKRKFMPVGVKENGDNFILHVRANKVKTFTVLDGKFVWVNKSDKKPQTAVKSLEDAKAAYQYLLSELQAENKDFMDFLN